MGRFCWIRIQKQSPYWILILGPIPSLMRAFIVHILEGWAFIWIEGISIVIFIWYPTAPNMYRFSRIKIWAKINVLHSKQFFKVNSELQGDRRTFLDVSLVTTDISKCFNYDVIKITYNCADRVVVRLIEIPMT